MIKKNKIAKSAFSLIELSIVILIISILVAGSLTVSKTNVNNSKEAITKARMDTIYKAFTNFLSVNRRLPCPALLTTTKGTSTYGNETATLGTCTNTYISSTNAPNLVYGMVPITALGLDPDMAEDGWGNKFTYVADKRFTKQSASTASTDGFEIIEGTPSEYSISNSTDLSGIDIQGPSGTSLLTNKNGILLLISHGANKYKGFNATGSAQNTIAGVADENQNSCDENSGCSTAGTTSFNRVFIAYSSDPGFDDIVLYKTKSQLVRDAGLEFIMCSKNEARTTSYSWNTNGSYGCNVCSGTTDKQKACGKYGTWGALSSNTCTLDTSTCPSSSITAFLSINQAGPLPISGSTFTYNGGTLIIQCIGSGFSGSTGTRGMTAYIRNSADTTNVVTLGTVDVYFNSTGFHLPFTTKNFIVSPGTLSVGTSYKIRFEALASTSSDSNDDYQAAITTLLN